MRVIILFACTTFSLASASFSHMISPDIDDPDKPFSYFNKPTDQLAVMDEPAATEITPEGYLYTGFAELMFFVGKDQQPIKQRHRVLEQGYLPVFKYDYLHNDIFYEVKLFSAPVQSFNHNSVVNFILVTMQNRAGDYRGADFALGLRFQPNVKTDDGVADNRFKREFTWKKIGDYFQFVDTFNPKAKYEFNGAAFWRDGKALLIYDQEPTIKTYTLKHNGYSPHNLQVHDLKILPTTPVGILHYSYRLKPAESRRLTFKMPAIPITDHQIVQPIQAANPAAYQQKIIQYWQKILRHGMQLILPEQKVVETFNASLIFDLMAKDKVHGRYIQTVNKLHYHEFFLRDAVDIAYMYDSTGYPEYARQVLDSFAYWQNKAGLFSSHPEQYDALGQVLWAYGQHYNFTKDKKFAAQVFPSVMRAAKWLRNARTKDPLHLIPASNVKDNEYIAGHITGYNFLALGGLKNALLLAKALGKSKEEKFLTTEYQDYSTILLKRLDHVSKQNANVIPPTLDGTFSGQDWGNLLAAYPENILDPFDTRVSATLNYTRQKYQEGLMTYNDGASLHHYLTIKNTLTSLLRNEQEQVVKDLYSVLLHTSSTHAGFEYCIEPWGDRDFHANLAPHGWMAAEYRTLVRKMLIRETKDELHLLSAISPAWIVRNGVIAATKVPTIFGKISLTLRQTANGSADLYLKNEWRDPPKNLLLHIPWFMQVKSVNVDGNDMVILGDVINLPITAQHIKLNWLKKKTPTELSYANTVARYKAEYSERYKKYIRGEY